MQDGMFCWLENLDNILCLQNKKGIFISINSYVVNTNLISIVMAKCICFCLLSRISNKQKQHLPKNSLFTRGSLTITSQQCEQMRRVGESGEKELGMHQYWNVCVRMCLWHSLQPWKELFHVGTLNVRNTRTILTNKYSKCFKST